MTEKAIRQGKAQHLVTAIVMHCSATRIEWMEDATLEEQVEEIRSWHTLPKPRGNGWRDIGYHWIIGRDGRVLPGRPQNVIGAGVAGYNQGVIHICLIGGHGSAVTDDFTDHFTLAQSRAARRLIQQIKAATPIQRITGHNDHAAKACPGFQVDEWLLQAV